MIKLAVVVLIQQFAATEQYEILRRRTKNHKICLKMLYLFNNIQGKSRSDLIKRQQTVSGCVNSLKCSFNPSLRV